MANTFNLQTILSCQDNLSGTFNKVTKTIAPLSKQFSQIHKNILLVNSGIRSIFPPLTGLLGGAVIYTGIRNFKNLTLQTAELGAGINKTARQVNFGVENFQLWQYAAQKNGASPKVLLVHYNT
ncbi:MAG: hypothetical protein LBE20_04155 [Deltaproteobacteria bacterium]|jgi:hypothetical protein|nr:hypothetical protein [Deltaproteobacteria bacterium]